MKLLKLLKPALMIMLVLTISIILTKSINNTPETEQESINNQNQYKSTNDAYALEIQEETKDKPENNEIIAVDNAAGFLAEPIKDKVCLGVFLTEQVFPEVYYIIEDEKQEKLISMINSLEMLNKPDGIYKGRHYLGISLVYQGLEWQILSDGSFYHCSYDDEEVEYYAINSELSDMLLQIAEQDLGIVPFDPTVIKGVKSVEFKVAFSNNKDKLYEQTITDSSALSIIEKLLSEAEIMHGGSGCPFSEGIMTLVLEDGRKIELAMATDSCCAYFVNGLYFDYKPKDVRGKEDSGIYNSIVFNYFDEIPMAARGRDIQTNNNDEAVIDEITVAYDISLLSKGENIVTISELTDDEVDFVKAVLFNFMIKSAAFPGNDISDLEECFLIKAYYEDSTTTEYYAYLLDGRAVMQMGKDGYYSRLDDGLYKNLSKLVQSHKE